MEFGPLRQHILQLAISGQLVEQLDSEPVVEQVGPAPKPDEVPFELPPKWKWVQLEHLFSMQAGKFIKASNILDDGLYPCYGANGIRGYVDTFNHEGTCNLIGRVGSCGSVHIATGKIYVTDNAVIATQCALVDADCAYYFLTSLNLKQHATATAQPLLNKGTIAKVWYPLAPLEEQRRIVAKEEELLSRLDQMEAAYSEFAGPMTEYFRNLMLNKAIRGELVPQLDSEPEVEQVGPAPQPDEVPFELPTKWKWVPLGSLVNLINGDRGPNYPAKSKLSSNDTGLPFVSAGDLEGNEISSKSLLYLSQEQCQLLRSGHIQAGDFLLCIRGSLGKFAIAKESGGAIASSLVILRSKSVDLLNTKYLSCFLQSGLFKSDIEQTRNGSCQPNLSAKLLANFLVPLPPLEEQRRVVAKLEEVFAGVEKLGSLMEYA